MKVMISGGAGFIGSTIASACLDAGIIPIIVDDLSAGCPEFTRGRIFYEGDISDGALIDKIFAAHDIHTVIHCASLVVVWESVADPLRYYRGNVAKGIELVEHLVRNGCRRLIFSSSAAVYGATAPGAVRETDPTVPDSPYARTKLMMEQLLADCSSAYDLRVLALRYFNPIGADPRARTGSPAHRDGHVLARIFAALRDDVPFTVAGTGWPTRDGSGLRDYVHVWDLAEAHICALRRFDSVFPATGNTRFEAVNIGSGNGTTVLELVRAVEHVTGVGIVVENGAHRAGDLAGGFAGRDCAWQLLGWRPTRSVRDGVADALRWSQARTGVPGE